MESIVNELIKNFVMKRKKLELNLKEYLRILEAEKKF